MDEEGISDRQDGFFAVFPYIDTIAGSEDIPVDCLVHQSERRQFTSSGVEDTKPFVVNGQEQFAGGIVCYGENLLPLCCADNKLFLDECHSEILRRYYITSVSELI